MLFLPLGGAGEIGASCFYLNIDGTGIILDCGMHPQKTGLDALPDFSLIKDNPVDFALISHAHQDHLSALPFLVKLFPHVRVITTPQTRAAAELTLHNSVSILKDQLEEDAAVKIYSHDEIDLLIRMIEYRSYNEVFHISGYGHRSKEEIRIEFFDAGHIIGSAGILIEHKSKRIFYSGDISLSPQSLLNGASLPKGKINTLILETTYGSTDSATLHSWNDEALRFSKSLNKVFSEGGSVLIPVFALGKMQEILSTLWKLMLKGKLARTDIYAGGIGMKINRIYDYNRFVVNMRDPDFELKQIPVKYLYHIKNPADIFKNSCILLASSGMMIRGTASYRLGIKFLSQRNSAIFTVGFMEESTPGYRFANAIRGGKLKLHDSMKAIEVKCSVKRFRFTAHSKREELIDIARELKPDKLILIHGDTPAIDWVGSEILKNYPKKKVYAAEVGRAIEL